MASLTVAPPVDDSPGLDAGAIARTPAGSAVRIGVDTEDGGSILELATRVGEGATFRVTLPSA